MEKNKMAVVPLKKIIFENGITNDHINGFTSSL